MRRQGSFKFVRRLYDGDASNSGADEDTTPKFTQAQMNYEIGKARKQFNERVAELTKQLEDLKNRSDLTAAEKEELQKQIDETRKQFMTEKQRAELIDSEWRKKYENDLQVHKQMAETWKSKYESQQISTAILTAAQHPEISAFMPEQMLALLRNDAKLVPVLGADGKPTEEMQVVCKFTDLDPKTKKPVDLELPVFDVLKKMRQQTERFGNLFKHSKVDGLGIKNEELRSINPASVPDLSSQEAFDKWMDAHPNYAGR